jgi:S-adenosylmethionine-diacylgycerolhomoserine-N-methlytransferase
MTAPHSITEAERMDRHYRFQRYIYDATRTHYLIGRGRLIRDLAPPQHGTVLEIGCGTAWNLVRAATLYPTVRFHGLDISNAMLETAAAAVARHGLEGRVVLRQGDAAGFDAELAFGRRRFDRVYFSYALSMIPAWKAALEQAAHCVAHGGSLHIIDFGPCDELPPAFKRALYAFLAHYTVYPRTELESHLKSLASRHAFSLRFENIYRTYASHAVLTLQ